MPRWKHINIRCPACGRHGYWPRVPKVIDSVPGVRTPNGGRRTLWVLQCQRCGHIWEYTRPAFSLAEFENAAAAMGLNVYHVLPLQWSLYYVITRKKWKDFRERVKGKDPGWNRCSCPKTCRADTLDEDWEYEQEHHLKRFLSAKFICRGCHWLKSPPWRIQTWVKKEAAELPDLDRKPHITDCLGWSEAKVTALRERDLAEHSAQIEELARIEADVSAGKALKVPWSVDLSALEEYGYSSREVKRFAERMMAHAWRTLQQDE